MIPRAFVARALRHTVSTRRSIRTLTRPRLLTTTNARCASHAPAQVLRWASSKSKVDKRIEEITELYATAQDEFEIAMEETQKSSIYAEADRKAARDELTRVQEAYKAVIESPDRGLADAVKRRIGQRIRELEQGVAHMESMALEHD